MVMLVVVFPSRWITVCFFLFFSAFLLYFGQIPFVQTVAIVTAVIAFYAPRRCPLDVDSRSLRCRNPCNDSNMVDGIYHTAVWALCGALRRVYALPTGDRRP